MRKTLIIPISDSSQNPHSSALQLKNPGKRRRVTPPYTHTEWISAWYAITHTLSSTTLDQFLRTYIPDIIRLDTEITYRSNVNLESKNMPKNFIFSGLSISSCLLREKVICSVFATFRFNVFIYSLIQSFTLSVHSSTRPVRIP